MEDIDEFNLEYFENINLSEDEDIRELNESCNKFSSQIYDGHSNKSIKSRLNSLKEKCQNLYYRAKYHIMKNKFIYAIVISLGILTIVLLIVFV